MFVFLSETSWSWNVDLEFTKYIPGVSALSQCGRMDSQLQLMSLWLALNCNCTINLQAEVIIAFALDNAVGLKNVDCNYCYNTKLIVN